MIRQIDCAVLKIFLYFFIFLALFPLLIVGLDHIIPFITKYYFGWQYEAEILRYNLGETRMCRAVFISNTWRMAESMASTEDEESSALAEEELAKGVQYIYIYN